MSKRVRISIARIIFRVLLVCALAYSVYLYTTREAAKRVVDLDDQTSQVLVLLRNDITNLQARVDAIDTLNFEYDARVNLLSNRVKELEKPVLVRKRRWLS